MVSQKVVRSVVWQVDQTEQNWVASMAGKWDFRRAVLMDFQWAVSMVVCWVGMTAPRRAVRSDYQWVVMMVDNSVDSWVSNLAERRVAHLDKVLAVMMGV